MLADHTLKAHVKRRVMGMSVVTMAAVEFAASAGRDGNALLGNVYTGAAKSVAWGVASGITVYRAGKRKGL
jgi:hypothetical protein